MNFSEWHKQKLNEFLAEPKDFPRELCDLLKSHQLLPLLNDMGGCLTLRADQKIISFPWDNPWEMVEEKDLRIRNIALFQGSKKYDELLALISEQSLASQQCPDCKGTGEAPVPIEIQASNFVCFCGGLGWVPRQPDE